MLKIIVTLADTKGVTPRRRGKTPPDTRRDEGFTLVEVMAVLAIAGVLLGIAVGGWRSYSAGQAHRGAAESVVVLLRDAHQRAVTEGTTYTVDLTAAAGPWVMRQGACNGPARGSVVATDARVSLPRVDISSSCVVFLPRGTATPGSLDVGRTGSSKLYTIDIEGLTGRVSIS